MPPQGECFLDELNDGFVSLIVEKNNMPSQTESTFDARTLLLDLFSTRSAATHSLPTLCRVAAVFGISAIAVRTALGRLSREGKIESIGRGVYRAVANSDAMRERILGWKLVLERQLPKWSGGWVLVLAGPSARVDRTAWRWTLRSMELEGLRQVDADAWVRPDNLVGGAASVRKRLRDLGTPRSLLVARLDTVEIEHAEKWAGLWDVVSRQRVLYDLKLRLAESAKRLSERGDEEAVAESLRLGREAVKAILRDPLLPREIAPVKPLHQLIEEMIRYDHLGKAIWKRWQGPALN